MDHGGELTLDDFFGAAGVSLGEGFAHAHDGGDACGERALGLGGDGVIRLPVVLAALGVAHDGVARGEVAQHGGGDFSRVRPLFVGRDILRAQGHAAVAEQAGDLGEVRRGHADGNVAGLALEGLGQSRAHPLHELGVGSEAAIHFPVAGNEFALHGITAAVVAAAERRRCGPGARSRLSWRA